MSDFQFVFVYLASLMAAVCFFMLMIRIYHAIERSTSRVFEKQRDEAAKLDWGQHLAEPDTRGLFWIPRTLMSVEQVREKWGWQLCVDPVPPADTPGDGYKEPKDKP